jgi:hypothetical protein
MELGARRAPLSGENVDGQCANRGRWSGPSRLSDLRVRTFATCCSSKYWVFAPKRPTVIDQALASKVGQAAGGAIRLEDLRFLCTVFRDWCRNSAVLIACWMQRRQVKCSGRSRGLGG